MSNNAFDLLDRIIKQLRQENAKLKEVNAALRDEVERYNSKYNNTRQPL